MIAIKGWELNSIEAKRFSRVGEKLMNVRIDHNNVVTSVIPLNQTDVSIEFRFTANYSGIGFVRMDGKLVVADDSRSPESIAKEWGSTNNMPPELANIVHNAVISNCVITATIITRDIQLPPPVPLPQVDMSQQKKSESPKGMEVA
jgi:hypothetical protein